VYLENLKLNCHLQQASENEEQVIKLTEELLEKLKAIEKYASPAGKSSEMDDCIGNLVQ